MPIRIALSSDASAIAHIQAASWRSAYRGIFRDDYLDGDVVAEREAVWEKCFLVPAPNQYIIVAEDNGIITGFACAYGADDHHWGTLLQNLHVSPERKRQHIGTQLMAAIANWCSKGYPGQGLYLWVLEPNRDARCFYERSGGVNVGKDIWFPPGGGEVPKLRYVWEDLTLLMPEYLK